MLERLTILEKERDSIYSLADVEKPFDTFIDFEKKYKEYKYSEDNESISKYTMYKANNFMDKYGVDGLLELVDLLNEFDNREPLKVYKDIQRMDISKDYKDQLLIWISTYSVEEMKTKYMIKNHCF